MGSAQQQAAVREALEELEQYLADELAPMMVADSVKLLMGLPDEVSGRRVDAWIRGQYRGRAVAVPYADFAFHALKKLVELADLKLVPRELVHRYVESIARWIYRQCPDDQREAFRANVQLLAQDDSSSGTGFHAAVIRRPGGAGAGATTTGAQPVAQAAIAPPAAGAAPGPASVSPPATTTGATRVHAVAPPATPVASPGSSFGGPHSGEEGLLRLEVLMRRVEERLSGLENAAGDPVASPALSGQLISTAAAEARSVEELEKLLGRLGQLGIDTELDEMIGTLGRELPGWVLREDDEGAVRLPESRSERALSRLVSMPENDFEVAGRLQKLIVTALEKIDEGDLGKAIRMLEIAEKVEERREMADAMSAQIRSRAAEGMPERRLLELAKSPANEPLIRRVLSFFPSLSVPALVRETYEEEDRARRKTLLSLVLLHGAPARQPLLAAARDCLAGQPPDPPGYLLRNLVFLLRRVPREEGEDPAPELEIFGACAALDRPLIVLKEVIGALGVLQDGRAEKTLVDMLAKLQRALLASNRTPHSPADLRELLDRTTEALVAQGTVASLRYVVNLCLREEEELGNGASRLDALGGVNLSQDPELVTMLLDRLDGALPRKVLGVFGGKTKDPELLHLVRAVAGTPTPAVREALEHLAQRFAGQTFAEEAARALKRGPGRAASDAPQRRAAGEQLSTAPPAGGITGPEPGKRTADAFSGDIDLFGLPMLLQSVTSSSLDGILILSHASGDEQARLVFEKGRLTGCRAGRLRGAVAMYQLLENPMPGRFSFAREGEEGLEPDFAEPLDPMGLVLEGLRRHDELGPLRAIVADDARFCAGDAKPTVPKGETDVALLKQLFPLAASGKTAGECEAALGADSFTVRSLLCHWLQRGALQPV